MIRNRLWRWIAIVCIILSLIGLAVPGVISTLEPPILYGVEIKVESATLRAGQAIPLVFQRCTWEPFNSTGVSLRAQSFIRLEGASTATIITPVSDAFVTYGCASGRHVAYRLPDVVPPGRYRLEVALNIIGRWRTDNVTILSNMFEVIP